MRGAVLIPPAMFSRQCPEAVEKLSRYGFEIIQNEHGLPFDWNAYASCMDRVTAVIAGVENWTADRMKACPSLRIIARYGMGTDNFDIPAATDLGIRIVNAKGISGPSVAEFAMGLIIDIVRRISMFNAEVHDGAWVKHTAINLSGKTLGLVGFGGIARKVASLALSFGMKVLAYDVVCDEDAAKKIGVEFVSFEELLSSSMVISVHVPSLDSTYHLMDSKAFSLMKEGSYFVNTSRGSVVDEKALYKSLKSGHLKAAASDVFEIEPIDCSNPLLSLSNFIATPHTAAITEDANKAVGMHNAEQIIDFFEGRVPADLLN